MTIPCPLISNYSRERACLPCARCFIKFMTHCLKQETNEHISNSLHFAASPSRIISNEVRKKHEKKSDDIRGMIRLGNKDQEATSRPEKAIKMLSCFHRNFIFINSHLTSFLNVGGCRIYLLLQFYLP